MLYSAKLLGIFVLNALQLRTLFGFFFTFLDSNVTDESFVGSSAMHASQ